MPAFAEVSAWIEPPPDLRPPPAEDLDVEHAIIGGGYTGLSAALRLRELGHEVVLLEQQYCGYGASGRNAGHVTPTIGKDIFSCLRLHGARRGLELIRFGERAVEHTERLIRRLGIGCDYRPSGNIIAGVHASQRDMLRKSAQLATEHGLDASFLDEAAMRARGLPAAFLFGVRETGGGHLHPGKYVLGLRRAALEAGVLVHERSLVSRVERGSPVLLHVGERRIRARKLLVAANAFAPTTLGLFRHRIAPLAVSLFRTAPLDDAQLARIGWTGREGIYTAHESLENYRLTADNRMVGGSKYVRYGYGSRLPSADDPETFAKLACLFRARFPELADATVEQAWSGWIALVLDFLPLCGRLDETLYYSLGYNGHGIAQATMMGAATAERMAGVENEALAILDRRAIPFPPEPLRWLTIHAILAWLSGRDRRLDRRIRKEAA